MIKQLRLQSAGPSIKYRGAGSVSSSHRPGGLDVGGSSFRTEVLDMPCSTAPCCIAEGLHEEEPRPCTDSNIKQESRHGAVLLDIRRPEALR